MRNVGYVLKRYPRLSETFILQEILGLERLGVPLHIFAIMDPHEAIVHSDVQKVRAQVQYLHTSTIVDVEHMCASHAKLFFRAPRHYLGALKHVLDRRQPGRRGLFLALKHFVEAGYLAELVERYHIDHLHAHFATNPTSLARFAQLLVGVPFSFTAHAKDIYTSDVVRLAEKIEYSKFTVTCTAYNQHYLNSLAERLRPTAADKAHLVYHGVDAARFKPLENKPQSDGNGSQSRKPALILSVGRLVSKKGHAHLIRACRLLKQRGYSFRCEIYGTGPLKTELQNLIRQLEVEDCISLKGARTQEELVGIYQTADVFALAPFVQENGDRDGLPNVLLEAMACGVAVVGTNISGIPELVTNEETGLLAEPNDVDGLAGALGRLLVDSKLRARLVRAGRRTVERYFAAETNVIRLAALFGFVSAEQAVYMPLLPTDAGAVSDWSSSAEVRR